MASMIRTMRIRKGTQNVSQTIVPQHVTPKVKAKKKSLWERLKSLFRKIKGDK